MSPWITVPLRSDVRPVRAVLIEGQQVSAAGVSVMFSLDLDALAPQYVVSSRRMDFEDIVRFGDELYLSAAQGLVRFRGGALQHVVDAALDDIAPRILQELNGVLWIFGYDGVARFDGARGEIVPFPPVHR